MANPIATIIDLNGAWASGGVTGPFISVSGNALSVDMSAYGRPFAAGSVLTSSTITVTFGDDSTHTATLIPAQLGLGTPDTIHWSNSSAWTKVLIPASTLVDLNGKWVSAGTAQPAFNVVVSGRFISIDMTAAGRFQARGYVLDFADIFVDFPDANGYTGRLQSPNAIHWSNNSIWQKVIVEQPSITSFWETSGQIKTLFVLGNGFPPELVTIRVYHQNLEIGHFTGVAGSDGSFTLSQAISCTSFATLSILVFEGNQATPVVTMGTLCPMIPT